MEFVPVDVFTDYIEANIVMGRLQNEEINCWLMNENTITTDPILTNALGGIRLMVPESQARRARELLMQFRHEKKTRIKCPNCRSDNIELVTTPRKASNWFWTLIGGFLASFSLASDKVYHCFNCSKEFPESEIANDKEEN